MISYVRGLSPYVILSYPRAGSHYLQNLLFMKLGIAADKEHKIDEVTNKDRFVISIIRNPLDTIASIVAGDTRFDEDYSDKVNESWNEPFAKGMDMIEKNADIILDFEEMVSNPDMLANKVGNALGMRVFDNGHDPHWNYETGVDWLKTAKPMSAYNDIYNKLASVDLSIANEAYNRLLSKAI